MALKIWLPLAGNLDNFGTEQIPIEAVTEPNYENGKIRGQSLSEGKIKIPAEYTSQIFNNEHMSMCFWYNNATDSTTGNHAICGFSGNGEGDSGATRIWDFFNYSTPNSFHWSMGTLGNGVLSDAFPAGTWVHVAVTFDGSNLCVYLNGELKTTQINRSSDYTFDKSFYISFGKTPQQLNDFRIYDECLTKQQVKEISQGLICHYKLEGIGANENIILRSEKITGGGQSTGITRTYMDDGTMKIVSEAGNGNWCSISFAENSNTNVGNKLSVGDTYTISCDIKVEEGTVFPTLFINSGNGYRQLGGVSLKLGHWQRVYYTNIWNEPGTSYGNISLHLGFSGAIGTYYFKNFKLEKGHLTSWIPAPTDPLYPFLGHAGDVYISTSGYGYHAIQHGILTYDENTPRYKGSTKFNNGYLEYITSPLDISSDAFTITCWLYPTQQSTMALINDRTAVGDGLSIFYLGGGIRFDTDASHQFQSGTITLNTWNFIACTYDKNKTIKKVYINGVLVGSTTNIGTLTNVGNFFSIGNSSTGGAAGAGNQIYGNLSDFRFYVTALSDSDILDLYNAGTIIDKNGNIHSYEFIANEPNMMWNINNAIIKKTFEAGLERYTQTNCQIDITNDGYHIFRPPNIVHDSSTMHNMWGGLRIDAQSATADNLKNLLIKGHKYIILYDVKGKTSNAQATIGWSNLMGWGGGGLIPQPSNVIYKRIPANFNSSEWETFFYKWDLNDDVYKECTSSYSSFVQGNTYLSYRHFQIGWEYTNTGDLGTDIYIRNIRMYDITNINEPQLLKTGIVISDNIDEIGTEINIRKIGYNANNFIEI